jgi:hypothetical protein
MRASKDENTPIRNFRLASTSELPMKVVSPERELILPYRRTPSVSMVLKFNEDVQQLRKDNEYVKCNLNTGWP